MNKQILGTIMMLNALSNWYRPYSPEIKVAQNKLLSLDELKKMKHDILLKRANNLDKPRKKKMSRAKRKGRK